MDQKLPKLEIRFFARIIDSFLFFIISFIVSIFTFVSMFLFSATDVQKFNSYQNEVNSLFTEVFLNNTISYSEVEKKIDDCNFSTISKQDCQQVTNQIKVQNVISLTIVLILNIVYFTVLPLTSLKATLGKIFFKLKIVSTANDSNITFLQAFTREIFWFLYTFCGILAVYFESFYLLQSFLIFVITISTLQIIFNHKDLSLHDKLANTQVIY